MSDDILTKRRSDVDFLRALGFLLIVLAHVGNAPTIIMQLRNFDVVLMVMVMGMSYMISGGRNYKYPDYVVKRFKRLIFPAWGFLIIYFGIATILKIVLPVFNFNINDVICSFILQTGIPGYGGIGYVWIFRVYFLMALIAPVLRHVSVKCTVNMCIMILIGLVAFNEAVNFGFHLIAATPLGNVISQIVPYLTGYAVALFLGIIIEKLGRVHWIALLGFFSSIFAAHILLCGIELTQTQKYPPRAYYLSYAVMASMICYIVANMDMLKPIVQSRIVLWFSKNSLWLYLWHIIPLKIITSGVIPAWLDNFYIRYICILFGAAILVEFQALLKMMILDTFIKKN